MRWHAAFTELPCGLEVRGRRGAATPRTRTALTAIDVRTGLNAGQVVDVTPTTIGTKFAGDIVIRPGVVIVAGAKGLYALRTKPITRSDPGRDF